MESNAEMMGRLTRVSESSMLLPDQAALLRWAVQRIAELEEELKEIRDNPGQTYTDVLAPDDDEYSLGVRQAWQRASAYAASALSPAPAKEGEAKP